MTAKPALAMAVACVVLGGVLTCAWTQDAAPAPEAKLDEALLQARSNTLRAEFVKIASPLIETLERERSLGSALVERQVATRGAEAAYRTAKLAREVARNDLTEYVEGTSKQEWETVEGEIVIADQSLRKSEDNTAHSQLALEQIRTALEGKSLTASDISSRLVVERTYETDRLLMQRAKFALESAHTKRKVVREFTKPRRIKELQAAVEQKRSEELACEAKWALAKVNEAKAEREKASAGLSPVEQTLLTLLANVARPGGVEPPTLEKPAEFRAYLDKLEAKLAEARSLVEQVREAHIGERFSKMRARILDRPAELAK